MRVTNKMAVERVKANLQTTMARLAEAQDRMSTGKRLRRPSDDPPALSRALTLRRSIAENEQYLRNLGSATTWLASTDGALESAADLMTRAIALATRGANGTWGPEQMQAMSVEVDSMLDELVQTANSSFGGDFLFSGFKQGEPPFALSAGRSQVDYLGDTGLVQRTIGPATAIAVGVPGQDAFADAFASLIALRDTLASGDAVAVSQQLADLQAAQNCVLAIRAKVGAQANYLEEIQLMLRNGQIEMKARLSQDEDIDIAEATTQYALDEIMYKAALVTTAKALAPSLIDYLT